jgi:hypothetical protein
MKKFQGKIKIDEIKRGEGKMKSYAGFEKY